MIKKSIVSIFCMLVITTGFSFGVLAEQNDKIVISESRILETEAVSNEIIYDSDAIPSSYMLDTLDQQQTVDADLAWCISENGYFAQSFIPTLEQLTRVELKLYKKGNPAGLTISIRSYLDNSDLTSKYLSSSSIPTNKTWLEFDFPDITVLPGKTYYIVWDPMGVPDNTTNFFWCTGINNPYVNGSAWHYLGSFWEPHSHNESPNPDFCFKTYGLPGGEDNLPPNKPTTPSGEASGEVGVSYTYGSSTTDSDGDQIYYLFDWGDDTDSGWVGPYDSGDVCQESHIWSAKGSYSIKVKAKDTSDAESSWSDPLPITMPYSHKPILQFLQSLLERFPHAFPHLRHLVRY